MYDLYSLAKTTNDNDHTFHLFVRSKDPKAEQWEGSRSGEQAAIDIFNADEVWAPKSPQDLGEES